MFCVCGRGVLTYARIRAYNGRMPKVTAHKVKTDTRSTVVVSYKGTAWSPEAIAERAAVLREEVNSMPKLTNIEYRANAGRDALDVLPVEGSFDDHFALLTEHRGSFLQYDVNEFMAEGADGAIGRATIINTFKRESVRRGLVIGERIKNAENADLPKNEFMVTLRGSVDTLNRLPGWYRVKAMKLGIAIPDGFVEVTETVKTKDGVKVKRVWQRGVMPESADSADEEE